DGGKLHLAEQYDADTVMGRSTGKDLDAAREAIIQASSVTVGNVPIYQVVTDRVEDIADATPQHFLDVIEHQARQGVDYMTIHAGILIEHLPLVSGRVTGILSRGG